MSSPGDRDVVAGSSIPSEATNTGTLRQGAPFQSPAGDEPYVVVSYSHQDEVPVYAVLTALHRTGVRIWFDKHLSVGRTWREDVASFIEAEACAGVLFFLSPNSLSSVECYRELACAEDAGKLLMTVALEPVQLRGAIGMIVRTLQWVVKYESTRDDFRAELVAAIPTEAVGVPPRTGRLPPEPSVEESPSPSEGAEGGTGGTSRLTVRDPYRELSVCLAIGVQTPGADGWRGLDGDAEIPRGSRLRVMVQPETSCAVALAVESLDVTGNLYRGDVNVFGPGGDVSEGLRGHAGIWDVIPSGGVMETGHEPEQVAAYRLGLLFSDTESLLADAVGVVSRQGMDEGLTRHAAGKGWRGLLGVRPGIVPLVTSLAFHLPEGTCSVTLEGRGCCAHLTTVRFV